MINEYQIKPTVCPCCGQNLDSLAALEHERPNRPGDCSICAHCHALLIFESDNQLRLPTAEEFFELRKHPQVVHIYKVLHHMEGHEFNCN